MAISDRLTKLATDITSAYTSIENKGGTIPSDKNTNNLATAINSIEVIEPAIAEGDSLSLINTKAMPVDSIVAKGKTQQFTTTGKNKCNLLGTPISGVTFSESEIHITGTYSSNQWQGFTSILLPPGTYTLSFIADFEITNNTYMLFNGTSTVSTNKATITLTEETNASIGLVISSGTYNNNVIKVQIESGASVTSYEPYTAGVSPNPSYPQEIKNVKGKNLFDKTNPNLFNSYIVVNGNIILPSDGGDKNNCIYIPCAANTTYTVQKKIGQRFGVAYTYDTPAQGVSAYGAISQPSEKYITITTDSNAKFLVVYVRNGNVSGELTLEEALNSIQIEERKCSNRIFPI